MFNAIKVFKMVVLNVTRRSTWFIQACTEMCESTETTKDMDNQLRTFIN